MELKDSVPLVVYDNQCRVCFKLPKIVTYLENVKIGIILN